MDTKNVALHRYLYEYMFYRSIRRHSEKTGQTIMVSQAKALRNQLEDHLRSQGKTLTVPRRAGISDVTSAIDATLSQLPGYKPLFGDHTADAPGYKQLFKSFANAVGRPAKPWNGEDVTAPVSGDAGVRLPISPFDPRFSSRSTVKRAGSSLLYVPGHVIDAELDGDLSRVSTTMNPVVTLWSQDNEKEAGVEAGSLRTIDDASGMSALMDSMSEREYRDALNWVVAGARDENGAVDFNQFMSEEGIARSVAILQMLKDEGIGYSVSRDRYPGQICAKINGTRVSVNLTKLRNDEAYIGSVYDSGVKIHFSTDHKIPGGTRDAVYAPRPDEVTDLVRVALGRPLATHERFGERGTWTGSAWSAQARRRLPVQNNGVYLSSGGHMSLYGLYRDSEGQTFPESHVFIRRDASSRSAMAKYFADPEAGEAFLRDAVQTAAERFTEALAVDRLIQEARDHAEAAQAGEYTPEFSGDSTVASIQRSYWDILTGSESFLLRPGIQADRLDEQLGAPGVDLDGVTEALAITGEPEQIVREHAGLVVPAVIGTYDLREVEEGEFRRFDPVMVSQWMESSYGVWRNNDDLIAAISARGLDVDELSGDSFFNNVIKDRLIQFDEVTARSMTEHPSEFISSMGTVVRDSLVRNGITPTSIMIDDQGIVSWSGEHDTSLRASDKSVVTVSGTLGQIFDPGEYGEITTKFNSGENYMFVPGYEADIVVQKPGENLSFVERTRLRGYRQLMTEQIQYQIANDALSSRTEVGSTAGLNSVYRRLYDVRHDVDFIERSREEGMSQEWIETLLRTEGQRVRYSNELRSGSTINAEYRAEHGRGSRDVTNDNFFDAWTLTGQKNLSIMGDEGNGYFDPIVTAGSINQGITRYLVDSARVDADGRIIQGAVDDRTALMKHPDTQFMKFDPFDRQQMTASNLMQASSVTKPVGTAMMTFGGWTFDDPIVVSRRFSEGHQVRGVDGTVRPLVVGDKLSDLHGNKGVISLIVDPDEDIEDTPENKGLLTAQKVFRDNPDLDVVMSPFSAVSRFNGGSMRELNQKTDDLHTPAGVVSDGLGQMSFIVTHMAVDAKTRIYDSEDIQAGKGRKYSSQLAWAMGSKKATAMQREMYGANSSSVANVREMLISMGMDMEADGTLRVGYAPQTDDEQRRVFEQPDLVLTQKGGLNVREMRQKFGELIGDKGGDLEIPFPLTFPTQQQTERLTDTTWKLPIMSSHLRSGQELADGTSTVHDYTNNYMRVFEAACRYRHAQDMVNQLGDPSRLDAKRQADLRKHQAVLAKAPGEAQMAYNSITNDLATRKFSGKRNVFKEALMSSRAPNSATAVWTADPRLKLDQMAMGSSMMEAMGVSEGDHVLVWRDPILRDSGVRYLSVTKDDRLTGVAINPVMDKCFDGDFDGDSVAVVKLNSKEAQREAYEKFSVPMNLLDLSDQLDDGTYALNIQDSLDMKVSEYNDPVVAERLEDLRMQANDMYEDYISGSVTLDKLMSENRIICDDLSDHYINSLDRYGTAALSFGDVDSHLDSVTHSCVETGAKGSAKKVTDYARYLGAQWDETTGAWQDVQGPLVDQKDHQEVQYATSVKAFGTGIAGTFSQRGVKALRNDQLTSVLELTYPVTQSTLQSKHDPEEARLKYEMMMGPARSLWQGRKMEPSTDDHNQPTWVEVTDDQGNPVQATREEWVEQFKDIYSSKHGLNVSVNDQHIENVADALSDDTGVMLDLEDEKNPMGSPMDRLAYGGDVNLLISMAHERQNIFAGEQNQQFAPMVVRQNAEKMAQWDTQLADAGSQVGVAPEPELVAVTARDVSASGPARGSAKRHVAAVAAGGRREAPAAPAPRISVTQRLQERLAEYEAARQRQSDTGFEL